MWFGISSGGRVACRKSLAVLITAAFSACAYGAATPSTASSESGRAQTKPAAPLEKSLGHSLPAGTTLYLRLETPVSTTHSHLNGPVTATVIRQVFDGGEVVVPLGAKVTGKISRLIPSSNPADRAKMRLDFDHLILANQPPLPLAGQVTQIENARETILPSGEIVGVLASEVPASLINSALGRIGQAKGAGSQGSANPPPSWIGQADTTIDYPAGTDFDFVLDRPLTLETVFPQAFASELPAGDEDAILGLLAHSPKRVASKSGEPGDPVNLVLLGTEQEIQDAFHKAGWVEAARMSQGSLWDAVRAVIKDQGYGAAPVSDLYLFGRREDLAFEKMLNTMAKRHHIRLWRSGTKTPEGKEIWLAAATHDIGIDIHPGVISHAIDLDLDLERSKVAADLGATGFVAAEQTVNPPEPLREGSTATGGSWKTDGHLVVILLQR